MARMYRTLPYQGGDPRAVAEIVNNAMNGKTNNTGTITLPSSGGGGGGSTTTYTVNNERAGFDSVILFMPLSNVSAGKLASIFVSARNKGNFVVTYNNSGSTDIELAYIIVG